MTDQITLVFDWGDTVMKVFPECNGPMKDWEHVAEVENAGLVLGALDSKYQLVMASNATESNAADVRDALHRVGLDTVFDHILTTNELGASKPSYSFFQSVERSLQSCSGQMVMIGDDFKTDILGAKHAGWSAVWLNTAMQPSKGLTPVHDKEIFSLSELPKALETIFLPDFNTCQNWLLRNDATATLLHHTFTVSALSYLTAHWILETGEKVDPILAHRGGMLHDIGKIQALGYGKDHGAVGSNILLEYGYPELAEIANRHALLFILDEERHPRTWEEKIVYYVDKLVHDVRIISPQERLYRLAKRYPMSVEEIFSCQDALLELHEDFCQQMSVEPEELITRYKEALWSI